MMHGTVVTVVVRIVISVRLIAIRSKTFALANLLLHFRRLLQFVYQGGRYASIITWTVPSCGCVPEARGLPSMTGFEYCIFIGPGMSCDRKFHSCYEESTVIFCGIDQTAIGNVIIACHGDSISCMKHSS